MQNNITNTRGEAYHTGYEACGQCEERDANPYPPQSWDADEWFAGWDDAASNDPVRSLMASEKMAYEYAVRSQGFVGTTADWLALSVDERAQYEQGAAGIPTE